MLAKNLGVINCLTKDLVLFPLFHWNLCFLMYGDLHQTLAVRKHYYVSFLDDYSKFT